MQLKRITAIIVLLLVVSSLLVAGCTTSNTNQTPSASTATLDAFLEKYLTAYKNSNPNVTYTVWELEWINSTSAQLQYTFTSKTTNVTWNYNETWLVFSTSQDATDYLNAMNKTAYSLNSTQYESKGAYYSVTGHAPDIYKKYVWNEGDLSNISEYKGHVITQLDNLISIETGTRSN